ncbi:complex I assembly factor TIMMDC1, mitochondrial, partial [Egretta garzetta]|uniref:complex I assembly factor TIMMDC1, mitochondrial n=1 Tax=Egretta garzetta TaxID=188379 RepID=UPI00163D3758
INVPWEGFRLFKCQRVGERRHPDRVKPVASSSSPELLYDRLKFFWLIATPRSKQQLRRFIEQSAHRAGLRSFIRYGWRWSWRVAVFVTIFNTVSTGLSVYRNKTAISNFAAAGAFTGALFRMHLGLQGLAGGFMFGTAFGIPAGGLLMIMQKLAGETLQERRHRERRELYEQKLAEWQSRLSVTEVLGQMEGNAQGGPETEQAGESRSY